MFRKLLLPALAATVLAGCVTDYNYRGHGGSGDYYYGRPSVEYRYYGGYGGYGGHGYPYYGGYGYWGSPYPYRYGYSPYYSYPRYPYYRYPYRYDRHPDRHHGQHGQQPGKPRYNGGGNGPEEPDERQIDIAISGEDVARGDKREGVGDGQEKPCHAPDHRRNPNCRERKKTKHDCVDHDRADRLRVAPVDHRRGGIVAGQAGGPDRV